jgi:transcriptional regulator with XRE-family HTH domain
MSSTLGVALRELRERTEPAAVGLPAGGRRRTRGLRREELAELAGVSADYVRRLEQGRGHPSVGVVNAVARALRLERAEYERRTLDGDLLAVPGGDLLAIVFTARPGSADAARLGEIVAGAGEPATVSVGQIGPG